MIESYLERVVERLAAVAGERLLGAWLFGSAALGDFDPARSDLDVQAVTRGRLSLAERERLVRELSHPALPCPVRGLELVLYAVGEIPAYQLNLNTGPRMDQHASFDPDGDPRFWFVLDVAIGRERGRALAGPPARAVFPAQPDAVVAASLLEALAWWEREPGAAAQAVLAACRAWAWAVERRWLTKREAAAWALARLGDPHPVERALAAAAGPADAAAIAARARAELSRP